MNTHMRAWKIRTDIQIEKFELFINKEEIQVDYGIKNIKIGLTKVDLERLVRKSYLYSTEKRIIAHTNQIFRFMHEIKSGDLVVMPVRKSTYFCIGATKAGQVEIDGTSMCLPVKWLRTNIPLNEFQQDIKYSFMAIMKVCEIKRNNAVARLYDIAAGKADPGYQGPQAR